MKDSLAFPLRELQKALAALPEDFDSEGALFHVTESESQEGPALLVVRPGAILEWNPGDDEWTMPA